MVDYSHIPATQQVEKVCAVRLKDGEGTVFVYLHLHHYISHKQGRTYGGPEQWGACLTEDRAAFTYNPYSFETH